mgnify:CR=1 FL=1
MLKKIFISCLTLVSIQCISIPAADELPLVYSQQFNDRTSLEDFRFTSPNHYAWTRDSNGNGYLEITEPNDDQPPVRSPHSIAVLDKFQDKDFTLTVDTIQQPVAHDCKGEDCIVRQHRNMCIFWGIQDSSHFYYAYIDAKCDEVSHQVHIVNKVNQFTLFKSESVQNPGT